MNSESERGVWEIMGFEEGSKSVVAGAATGTVGGRFWIAGVWEDKEGNWMGGVSGVSV